MYRTAITRGNEVFDGAMAVRTAVFMEEQGFHDEFDEIDAYAYHAVVYDGELAIATGRTFREEAGGWHIGRVAVRKEYRGKGIGALVMRALEERLQELGATGAKLSAQLHAVSFYERLGYRPFGPQYLDEHTPHIAMRKKFSSL